jgi:hypothetical protein
MIVRFRVVWVLAMATCVLAACGNSRQVTNDEYNNGPLTEGAQGSSGKVFGSEGLSVSLGGTGKATGSDEGGALGVNAYLWRGTLDTLSFMPLSSADPFGGVIITDWFQPPSAPGERFKATAYILGRQLRADGVRVVIFRQVAQGGQWVDAPVATSTTSDIENKVLARARELRSQSASN